MIKYFTYLFVFFSCFTTLIAQNNAIFSGGNADGYDKNCYLQPLPVSISFSGGINDGYAKGCYMQTSNLNTIFSGGVGGDGMLNGCANEPLGCFFAVNLGNDTTICAGQTLTLDAGTYPGGAIYLWQDSSTAQTFVADSTGLYYVYVTDTAGCSGVDSINVTVNPMPSVFLGNDTSFCAGNNLVLDAGAGASSYLWQNTATPPYQNQTLTVTAAGTYYVVTTLGACNTSDTINVTVNPIITTTLTDSIICQGDSALIFGTYQSVAGNYQNIVTASTGCDSILSQNLVVNPTYNNNLGTVTVCQGDSALILGNYETVAGVYSNTLQTINGCDSIVSQTLVVSPIHTVNLGNDTSICAGNSLVLDAGAGASSYLWQNSATPPYQNQTLTVNATGTYFVAATIGICSDADTINVTVNPIITTTLADSIICQGDSALIFGTYQSVGGNYQNIITASTGCDSILSQNLVVHPTYNNNLGTVTICQGDSALIFGVYQTIPTTYYDSLQTTNGCDSVVFQTLSVLSNASVNLGNDTSICAGNILVLDAGAGNSYQWQDNSTNQTFSVTTSGFYYVNVTTGSCSASDTINVTVNPVTTINLTDSIICQGDSALIFGAYQSIAGNYQDTLISYTGCDSILTQNLIVNPSYSIAQNAAICQGDSILLGGVYQTSAGIYNDSLSTINGCDSVLTTTLTIYPKYNINQFQTICDGDSILLGGVYQTTASVYYDSLFTINGCDSIVATTLSINPSFSDTIAPITICQGDSALMFGVYQSVAGTYQGIYSAYNTCDSIVSQDLIVNALPVINLGIDSTICENDSIILDAGTNVNTYNWNTGDTTQTIWVNGNVLGVGSYIYTVQGTDSNGCAINDTIIITVTICSGINEFSVASFQLYPNPTKGELTLSSNKLMHSFEVYNVLGEKLMIHKIEKRVTKFDVSSFPKGVYFVRVLYESNHSKTIQLILN